MSENESIGHVEAVDHPKHYNSLGAECSSCGHPIECIDVIEHMNFNVGTAVKYGWRKDFKANALEDLKKMRWYIDREIANIEKRMKKKNG